VAQYWLQIVAHFALQFNTEPRRPQSPGFFCAPMLALMGSRGLVVFSNGFLFLTIFQ